MYLNLKKCVILDAKCEKAHLYKVLKTQYQRLTITQRIELLKLFQIFEDFSIEHLENRYIIILNKTGYEANIFANISSN